MVTNVKDHPRGIRSSYRMKACGRVGGLLGPPAPHRGRPVGLITEESSMSDAVPDDYFATLHDWRTYYQTRDPRSLITDLMLLYSHAASWKRPEYEKLDPDDRLMFTAMVKGRHAGDVKDLLTRCCLAHDVLLNDKLVADVSLALLQPDRPIDQDFQKHVGEMHGLGLAGLIRLGVKLGLGKQLTSGSGWRKSRKGRPPIIRVKDTEVCSAWATGAYRTYADLAKEKRLTSAIVKQIVDRNRKGKRKPSA